MIEERLMQVIIAPVVTEKSSLATEKSNQHVFKVASFSTKKDVKQAVESLFKVEVQKVTLLNVKGKVKMFRQKAGKRKNWKKAYVTLKEGSELNYEGVE